MTADGEKAAGYDRASWRHFQEEAHIQLDESGHPILLAPIGGQNVAMGITRDDIAREGAPAELQMGLLEARLRQQLTRGRAPKVSNEEVRDDWRLLQEINTAEQLEVSGRTDQKNQKLEGNSD